MTCRRGPQSEPGTMWHARVLLCAIALGLVAASTVPAKAASASVPAKAAPAPPVPAKAPPASPVPAKAPPAPPVPAKAPPPSPVPAKPVPASASCDASKCDKLTAKFYEEIHCKPVIEKGACCPTRFDCPTVTAVRAEDKCHVAGVTYSAGANISDALSGPCTHACVCKEFADKVTVHCLTTECEEVPDGCVPLYKNNECCAHAFKCDNTSTQGVQPKKEATCKFEGQGFLEGERLPTPSHPCLDCVCQKGFNGSLTGPWCRERRCDLELRFGRFLLRGCAPVFHGDKDCCPASWRCPSSSDKVIPAKSKAPAPASLKDGSCVFGELRLAVGDELTPTSEDEQCACRLPPAVTCRRREAAFDLDLIAPQ